MLESRGTRWLMQEIMIYIFACDDHYFTDVGENFCIFSGCQIDGQSSERSYKVSHDNGK